MNPVIDKQTLLFFENDQDQGGGDYASSIASGNLNKSKLLSSQNNSDDEELLAGSNFGMPPINIVTNVGPDNIEEQSKENIEGIPKAAAAPDQNVNDDNQTRNLGAHLDERPTTSRHRELSNVSRQPFRNHPSASESDPIVVFHLRSRTAALNEEQKITYESLDYNVCENLLYKKEYLPEPDRRIMRKNILRWIIFILIGIFTALIACFNNIVIEELSHLKFRLIKESIDTNVQAESGDNLVFPYFIWMGLSIVPVVMGALIVIFIEPVAAGSGIPLVKCYLNGVNIPRFLRLKTLIVKNLGLIFSLVGGLAGGKEGPMAHSGSIVGAGISQGKTTSLNKDFGYFKTFRNDQEKRDFVAGGAAAGVSAAFGSPIGGMLFSLEEAASFWNQNLIWRTLVASILSSFTLNFVLSMYYKGILQFSGLFNLGKFQDKISYESFELPIFVLFGIVGGLMGSFWNMVNTKINRYRKRFIQNKFFKLLEALMISILGVSAACGMVYLISDCRPLGTDPTTTPIQLFCEDNEYNAAAALWFSTPEGTIKSLFHDPRDSYAIITLAAFTLIYYILSCITYGLSVSVGVFLPTVLVGAAWGRLVATIMLYFFPQATFFDTGKYALIGSAGHLGGVLRMTISLSVILLDTTGVDNSFFFPIIITLTSAKWVGDYFNDGLFDITIHESHVPMLPWDPQPNSVNIKAEQIMSSPVVCFNMKEKAKYIYDTLKRCKHNGFPVVDNVSGDDRSNGRVCGIILRYQLIVILMNSFYEENKRFWIDEVTIQSFRNIYPRFPSIEDVRFHEDKVEHTINFEIFMDPAPVCSWKNDSVTKIFRKFRAMGLRHIIVVDNDNRIAGMITRKDFLNK